MKQLLPSAAVAKAISTAGAVGETGLECTGCNKCDAAAAGLLASSVKIGARQADFIPGQCLGQLCRCRQMTSPLHSRGGK